MNSWLDTVNPSFFQTLAGGGTGVSNPNTVPKSGQPLWNTNPAAGLSFDAQNIQPTQVASQPQGMWDQLKGGLTNMMNNPASMAQLLGTIGSAIAPTDYDEKGNPIESWQSKLGKSMAGFGAGQQTASAIGTSPIDFGKYLSAYTGQGGK